MAISKTDTLPIGLAAGFSLATFAVLLVMHAKKKEPELAALGTSLGPTIAEDAVKKWINDRFGVTPDMMRRIASRTSEVQRLFG